MFAVERLGRTLRAYVLGLAVPPDVAILLNVDIEVGAAENDDTLDRGVAFDRVVDVLLESDDLAAPVAAVRRDNDAGAAVRDAVLDAFAAEPAKDHAMNSTDARACEHRDGRLRNVRKVNEDTRPFLAAVALEDVCKDADFAVKLLVGEDTPVAGFPFPNDGSLVAARPGEMAVEAIFRDIELCRQQTIWRRAGANQEPLTISSSRAGHRPASPRISRAT